MVGVDVGTVVGVLVGVGEATQQGLFGNPEDGSV